MPRRKEIDDKKDDWLAEFIDKLTWLFTGLVVLLSVCVVILVGDYCIITGSEECITGILSDFMSLLQWVLYGAFFLIGVYVGLLIHAVCKHMSWLK